MADVAQAKPEYMSTDNLSVMADLSPFEAAALLRLDAILAELRELNRTTVDAISVASRLA